jgi:hypothetical protein
MNDARRPLTPAPDAALAGRVKAALAVAGGP